jgi:hypothetical protein
VPTGVSAPVTWPIRPHGRLVGAFGCPLVTMVYRSYGQATGTGARVRSGQERQSCHVSRPDDMEMAVIQRGDAGDLQPFGERNH